MDELMRKSTIFIGGWNSRCGNCGKQCDPAEGFHATIKGYGQDNGDPGCGALWKYAVSTYVFADNGRKITEAYPQYKLVEGWIGAND